MQLLVSVNMDKLFYFVVDIVLRAWCIACHSVVYIELCYVSDADSVQFPVVAAAHTPISL